MISIEEYVGPHADSPDWTPARQANARSLLLKCAALEQAMVAAGVYFATNPRTGSGVSGATFGGFRPQSCPQGAAHSKHKEGQAVDRYDPNGDIDAWLLENKTALREYGIFIEAPNSTPGWSHWQSVPPGSGSTIFNP